MVISFATIDQQISRFSLGVGTCSSHSSCTFNIPIPHRIGQADSETSPRRWEAKTESAVLCPLKLLLLMVSQETPDFITLSNSQSTVTPRSLPLRTFHPITPEAVVAQRGCPRYIDFDVTATAYIHAARPRHRLSALLDIPRQACQLSPASFGTQHYFLALLPIVYQPISTSDQGGREYQFIHFRHPRALRFHLTTLARACAGWRSWTWT